MKNPVPTLVSAGLLLLSSVPAAGQSVSIESSMAARCLDADCSSVEFFLDLAGTSIVNNVDIFSHDGAWQFGALVGVLNQDGEAIEVAWWTRTEDAFNLWFGADTSPEPIRLIVDMDTWGTAAQLVDGSFTYSGEGINDDGHLGDFYGEPVPEPSMLLILLTGMMALAAVVLGRRHRLIA